MAGATLLTLLDDIATLLDDVATMSKVAVEKTAGVLGDDLALNAQQVSGVDASRELPVVWSVAKGSFVNKAILVPAALLFSALLPAAVHPLLMVGGIYLCFEGAEKILHRFEKKRSIRDPNATEGSEKGLEGERISTSTTEAVSERTKIRGAIRTDFVLSAEIIVIAMGTFPAATLSKRAMVLVLVAVLMTVGVYGLVASIVKMDDLGYYLLRSRRKGWRGTMLRRIGVALLGFAPRLLRFLAFAGTVAMFLVGGHILVEGIPALHHASEHFAEWIRERFWMGSIWSWFFSAALSIVAGLVAGCLALLVWTGVQRGLLGRPRTH